MTQIWLQALLACFLAGTTGVLISPNADLMESVPVGDMPAQGTPVIQSSLPGSEVLVQAQHVPQQFKPEPPRMLSGPQPHLPTLTNPWASQTNPNTGLSQLPEHFQYLPYPHAQQPQVHQFLYMVPQIQQRMAGPYGGLRYEELQNMGRMRRVDLHMPALRGDVCPVAGPQPVVPVSPLRLTKTFHPSTFLTILTICATRSDFQLPSIAAAPPSGDAISATGGSHPNNGALPSRIASVQDREQVPCDHILPAEDPLANTGLLDSDHWTFISAVVSTVQPDPHHSDPTFPTPEYKEALVPASPPLRSDTVTNTNTDMYP
ncbi:LOW QUALITY PROTEIN: ameloblastin [Sinocyclocheilus grahami]|uniref:LOW QUALITY PROTEIN: ameloblastin n=1 Tax=Sinocyclocheilus grahami TaxID=75366 RepID=UPI003A9A272A